MVVGGQLFRVVCEHQILLSRLREVLQDHVVESDALLGFQIKEGEGGLWTLLADSGWVLARSRDAFGVAGCLMRHLAALQESEEHSDMISFALQTLVRDDRTAAIFGPQAGSLGPWIERRLPARCSIVDSLLVRISNDAHVEIDSVPWALTDDLRPAAGHFDREFAASIPVTEWYVPDGLPLPSTLAQRVWLLAMTTRSGTRERRLDASSAIATRISRVQKVTLRNRYSILANEGAVVDSTA